jgi:tetratricopeptide (TPR) repeat protein
MNRGFCEIGDEDLTRKEVAILTGISLVSILALVPTGCDWGPGKAKETPLQKAERFLLKGDAASLQEARLALQEAIKADPQAARAHFFLGTVYAREAKNEGGRDKSEETYNLAMAELEKALELYGQTGAPVELYQQFIDVCYERASLPKRFHTEKDPKLGVGPWEVKAMEKAMKAVEEGRSRFPNHQAFSAEKGEAFRKELAALKTLYAENVQRAWSTRPSGYMAPDDYKKAH